MGRTVRGEAVEAIEVMARGIAAVATAETEVTTEVADEAMARQITSTIVTEEMVVRLIRIPGVSTYQRLQAVMVVVVATNRPTDSNQ